MLIKILEMSLALFVGTWLYILAINYLKNNLSAKEKEKLHMKKGRKLITKLGLVIILLGGLFSLSACSSTTSTGTSTSTSVSTSSTDTQAGASTSQ